MNLEAMKDYDMQLIGSFLHYASRGDRVGLNQMLREGTSPDVQDYDKRTALHLAASEGHPFIVELLVQYNANVNLEDRWQRTPLTDARSYGHRDICRILEVNGGKDSINDHPLEHGLNEVNIDPSELDLEHSSIIEQGMYGKSEKVKWRGTWVVKTIIPIQKSYPETKRWSAKEITRLRELRHPNILQFLGAIIHEGEIILITEYLSKVMRRDSRGRVRGMGSGVSKTSEHASTQARLMLHSSEREYEERFKRIEEELAEIRQSARLSESSHMSSSNSQGNLYDILSRKVRLDVYTSVRYALDIARGMNYLHQHKPHPFLHNYLCPRNLLQDEGGHLKIGEYWVQMLYEKIHPCQNNCQKTDGSTNICNSLSDPERDICSFATILYVMLEGRTLSPYMTSHCTQMKLADSGPKFKISRCPIRIQHLIQDCVKEDHSQRPTFGTVIEILEEVSVSLARPGCPVC